MFVNGAPFVNTYSCVIRFVTSRQQDPKKYPKMQAMKSIQACYAKKGFNIVELRGYQQFEPA